MIKFIEAGKKHITTLLLLTILGLLLVGISIYVYVPTLGEEPSAIQYFHSYGYIEILRDIIFVVFGIRSSILGYRIISAERYPLEGQRVVRNTKLRTGESARAIGFYHLAAGVGFCILGVGLSISELSSFGGYVVDSLTSEHKFYAVVTVCILTGIVDTYWNITRYTLNVFLFVRIAYSVVYFFSYLIILFYAKYVDFYLGSFLLYIMLAFIIPLLIFNRDWKESGKIFGKDETEI